MSNKCMCGHDSVLHYPGQGRCTNCGCKGFVSGHNHGTRDKTPDPVERIAVALESIAKSLDAMRRDGR